MTIGHFCHDCLSELVELFAPAQSVSRSVSQSVGWSVGQSVENESLLLYYTLSQTGVGGRRIAEKMREEEKTRKKRWIKK